VAPILAPNHGAERIAAADALMNGLSEARPRGIGVGFPSASRSPAAVAAARSPDRARTEADHAAPAYLGKVLPFAQSAAGLVQTPANTAADRTTHDPAAEARRAQSRQWRRQRACHAASEACIRMLLTPGFEGRLGLLAALAVGLGSPLATRPQPLQAVDQGSELAAECADRIMGDAAEILFLGHPAFFGGLTRGRDAMNYRAEPKRCGLRRFVAERPR
jgi:hypothetical protein